MAAPGQQNVQQNVQQNPQRQNQVNPAQQDGQNIDFDKYSAKTIPNLYYDGNPYTLNEFLFDYKLAAEGMDWNQEIMIKRFPLHLQGMAKQVFVNLTVDDRSTWDKLKDALTKNILVEPSPRIFLNEFRQRTLRRNETPLQYAYALRSIAKGAFPVATDIQRDAFLLDQFLLGIPDELRAQIVEKKTFDAASKKAQIVYLAAGNQSFLMGQNDVVEKMSKFNINNDNQFKNQNINNEYHDTYRNRSGSRDRYRDNNYSSNKNYSRNRSNSGDRNNYYTDNRNQYYRNDRNNSRDRNNFYKYNSNNTYRYDRSRNNSNERRDDNYYGRGRETSNDRKNNTYYKKQNNYERNDKKYVRFEKNDGNNYIQNTKSDNYKFNNQGNFKNDQNDYERKSVNYKNSNLRQSNLKPNESYVPRQEKINFNDRDKVNSQGRQRCHICNKTGHSALSCWYNQNTQNVSNTQEKSSFNYMGNNNLAEQYKNEAEEWQIKYERLASRIESDDTQNDVSFNVIINDKEIDEQLNKVYQILITPNVEKMIIKESLDQLLEINVPCDKLYNLIPLLLQYIEGESPYKGIIKVILQKYGKELRKTLTVNDKLKIKIEIKDYKNIEIKIHPFVTVRKIRRIIKKEVETDDIILIKFHDQNLDDDEYLIECGLLPDKENVLNAQIILPEQDIHEIDHIFIPVLFETKNEETLTDINYIDNIDNNRNDDVTSHKETNELNYDKNMCKLKVNKATMTESKYLIGINDQNVVASENFIEYDHHQKDDVTDLENSKIKLQTTSNNEIKMNNIMVLLEKYLVEFMSHVSDNSTLKSSNKMENVNEIKLINDNDKNIHDEIFKNVNEESISVENKLKILEDEINYIRNLNDLNYHKINESNDEIIIDNKSQNRQTKLYSEQKIEKNSESIDKIKNDKIPNEQIQCNSETKLKITTDDIRKECLDLSENSKFSKTSKNETTDINFWITSIIQILLIFSCINKIPTTSAIEAYDCSKSSIGSTYSLLDIDECPGSRPANLNITDAGTFHVYQESDYYRATARECIVHMSQTIMYCGLHSHIAAIKPKGPYLPKVPVASTCFHAFQTGELRMDNIISLKAKVGYKLHQREFRVGKIYSSGACEYGSYQIDGETNTRAIVIEDYSVELREYQASFDTIDGKMMTMPWCKAEVGSCVTGNSVITYKVNTNECNLIYIKVDRFKKVSGTIFKNTVAGRSEESEPVQEEKTPDVIMSISPGVHLRFIIGKHLDKCGETVRRTNYKGIYVSKTKLQESKTKLDKTDINFFTYFNNKLDFLFHTNRKSLAKAYEETIKNDCKLNREILRTKLAVAITNPHIVTPLLPLEKGVFGRMMGEALFTYKCTRVEAELAPLTECTNELPVKIDGQLRFVEPVTRILLPIGTKIKPIGCSNVLAPIYQIASNTWISLPGRNRAETPKQLELVNLGMEQIFKPLEGIATSGLYKAEDIAEARKYILFPQQRQKVITELVQRTMAGDQTQPDFELLLSVDHYKKATLNTMKQMWGRFLVFGQAMSGFMGVYIIITFIKVVMSQVLSTYHIHALKGTTWKLIFGCFPFLAKYIIINHYKNMKNVVRKEKATVYEMARRHREIHQSDSDTYDIPLGNDTNDDDDSVNKTKIRDPLGIVKKTYASIRKPPRTRPISAYTTIKSLKSGGKPLLPQTAYSTLPVMRTYNVKTSSMDRNNLFLNGSTEYKTTGSINRIYPELKQANLLTTIDEKDKVNIQQNTNDFADDKEDDEICTIWVEGGRAPCMKLTLNGRLIQAILDTGSPLTIINMRSLNLLQIQLIKPTRVIARSFSGDKISLVGTLKVYFRIEAFLFQTEIFIGIGNTCQCLIGMNIIEEFIKYQINWLDDIREIRKTPNQLINNVDQIDFSTRGTMIIPENASQELMLQTAIEQRIQELIQLGNRKRHLMNFPFHPFSVKQLLQETKIQRPDKELVMGITISEEPSLLMINSGNEILKSPREEIIINGKLISAIVDTGALISVIDETLLDKEQIGKIKPTNERHTSASRHLLQFKGKVKVVIHIKNQRIEHDIFVMNPAPSLCVLGMDILSKIKSIAVDLESNKIIFKDSLHGKDGKNKIEVNETENM